MQRYILISYNASDFTKKEVLVNENEGFIDEFATVGRGI